MRPQPDVYELPKLKFDFNLRKLIVASISIFVFFLLPVLVIQSLTTTVQNVEVGNGRVAGVNVSTNEELINILGFELNLNSKGGIFILLGIILVGISIILFLFLMYDNLRIKKISKKH